MMEIVIHEKLSIPDRELVFTASRSGGPGGQHVNKVNSRVTLHFNLWSSPSLTDYQKNRIAVSLNTRLNREGVLQLHGQRYRTQSANRAELVERFALLLRDTLRLKRHRIKTKISKNVKERRIKEKKKRGQVKWTRSKTGIKENLVE